LSWIRRDRTGGYVICITNFTPVVRYDYQLGVPDQVRYEEILNTDAKKYGGSGNHNDNLYATEAPCLGKPCTLQLTIPPLATLILKRESS